MTIAARCRLCQRPLDTPDDPLSTDCGGDCWGCIGAMEAEGGCPESLAKVKAEIAAGVRLAIPGLPADNRRHDYPKSVASLCAWQRMEGHDPTWGAIMQAVAVTSWLGDHPEDDPGTSGPLCGLITALLLSTKDSAKSERAALRWLAETQDRMTAACGRTKGSPSPDVPAVAYQALMGLARQVREAHGDIMIARVVEAIARDRNAYRRVTTVWSAIFLVPRLRASA